MKRSEYLKLEAARHAVDGKVGIDARNIAECHAEAAERAVVTWDPEEPEVLWEVAEEHGVLDATRLVRRGACREWEEYRGSWIPVRSTPVYDELARRILVEREGEGRLLAMRLQRAEQQLDAQKQIEECLRSEIRALRDSIEPTRKRVGRLERNIERAKAALVGCEIASGSGAS